MKYCPYCGAALPDGNFSFCPDCGKSLTISDKKQKAKAGRKKEQHENAMKKLPEETAIPDLTEENTSDVWDDYDGYYDDVLPSDNSVVHQTLDKEVIKKIILIVVGVIIAVAVCVAAMYLL